MHKLRVKLAAFKIHVKRGSAMSAGPLNGIKVLDLSRVLAGPYCSMILGDLGAEVIKVEAPGGSDDTRAWGPPYQSGVSAYYLCTNRNKQSLTLNLKDEQGRSLLKDLVQSSDVLLHNFKTGTMEKWGLDYESLAELNPRLIFCSITGFGKTGPYSAYPGYDFVIQAMSGLMSITGKPESGPLKVGVAITDVLTGLFANIAIQAALFERESSGKGQEIELSLFDSAIAALVNVGSNYLVSNKVPRLLGNVHPNIAPYQTLPTADGEMVVAVGNDHQFKVMCQVCGLTQLVMDPRFVTNEKRVAHRVDLEKSLSETFRLKSSKEWTELLLNAGVPSGPIHRLDEVFSDEHVKARGLVQKIKHPTAGDVSFVGNPIRFSRSEVSYTHHPPEAGEHTDTLLRQNGFSSEEIKKLRDLKII
jgi:crotonobetainyl-CoA:carnitine CoA-transferase CaiB-like acyl-CoA transferase